VRVDVASESEPVTLEVSNALAVNASVLVGEAPCERGQVHLLGSVALAAAIDRGQALFPAVPEGRYAARVQCAAGIAREFELSAPAAGDVRPVWKLEAGHELVGRVVSASGAGVPGLDLQWRATEANPSTPREFASACRTDAGGAFRCGAFAGGRYRCAIEGGAHDDCSDVVVPRETPLQIALRPLGTIRATLSESLTAVSVVATGSDGAEHFARYSGGDTFSIVGLPLGEYRVGLAGQPDLARARLDHDGQLVEVRLAAPAVVLEGRVVDERGEPIVEAWVRVSAIAAVGPGSEAPPALTGDGGEFSIPALAKGRYALSVTSSAGEARVDEAETGRPVLITLKAFGSMAGHGAFARRKASLRVSAQVRRRRNPARRADLEPDGKLARPVAPVGTLDGAGRFGGGERAGGGARPGRRSRRDPARVGGEAARWLSSNGRITFRSARRSQPWRSGVCLSSRTSVSARGRTWRCDFPCSPAPSPPLESSVPTRTRSG
jgi:hypothetical protein